MKIEPVTSNEDDDVEVGSKPSSHRKSSKHRTNSSISQKSRSKSPDDDQLVSSERSHRHSHKRSSKSPKRNKSTMSSSSNDSVKLQLSSDDDDTLAVSTRSRRSRNKRSSKSPRRSKSTMSSSSNNSVQFLHLSSSDDDNDNLALSERSAGRNHHRHHHKRSSKSPRRSKSTTSHDSLALSERSSGGRRRSSQRPRSRSTMSQQSNSISDDDRLVVSERLSSKSPQRASKEDRESKRKARLSAAAPGAFQVSDDEDDLLSTSDKPPSSRRSTRSSRQSKLDKEAKRRARSLSLGDDENDWIGDKPPSSRRSTRSSRQSKLDLEAKRRAQSFNSDDFSDSDSEEEDPEMALKLAQARYGPSSGPGAIYAANQSRSREDRKSERHGSSKQRSSSHDTDDDDDGKAKRSARNSSRANTPGAAQSTSIDMAARKHDRKMNKSIMMTSNTDDDSESDEEMRALKLAGARYRGANNTPARNSNSLGSRFVRMIRGRGSTKGDAGGNTAVNNGTDDGLLQAVIVDGNGNGTPEESSVSVPRPSQMNDEDLEQHRQRVREQNETNRREREAEIQRKEKERRKRRNRNILILLILLAIAGLVTYFLMRERTTPVVSTIPENAPEAPVTTDGSVQPSQVPSDAPSNPPTIYFRYDPPDPKDCEDIAAGVPIQVPDEDAVVIRNFDVIMEVDLVDDQDLEPKLPELRTKIEEILMPRLAGCPANDTEVIPQRNLQQQIGVENIRNVIADGLVSVSMSDGLECQKIQSDHCSVVVTNLDLRLLGDEMVLFIIGIISDVFHVNSPNPLIEVLNLNNPYVDLMVVMVTNNDPTAAPTTGMPSGTPSALPSSIPSSVPSFVPSRSPSIAPFPGSTPSPTCASIATNFDAQTFLQRSGTQDASYTVPCSMSGVTSNMVVLRRLGSACEVDCVADLSFAVFQPVCNQATSVDVILTGDYRQSTLYIGLLDSAASSYQCADTLQLDTPSPSLTPSTFPSVAPSESPSQSPTTFPTPTSTATPVLLDEQASSEPTVEGSAEPSLHPSSAPSSRYVDCYGDNNLNPDFFLHHHSFATSVDSCIDACADSGFSYAGLTSGETNKCFCGNTYGDYGTSTNCIEDCGGECGGQGVNSVYRTNVQEGRPEEDLPIGLECGCYQDIGEVPDFPYQYGFGDNMSQKACILGCMSLQYDFAAVSSRGVCWCGNDAGTYGEAPGGDEECYMSCNANGMAACYGDEESCKCGARFRNRVFRTSLNVECPAPPETETPQTVNPDPTKAPTTNAPTVAPVAPPTLAPVPPPTPAPVPPPTRVPVIAPSNAPSVDTPPPPQQLLNGETAYAMMSSSTVPNGGRFAIDGYTCSEVRPAQEQPPCNVAETLMPTTQEPTEYPWWEVVLGVPAEVTRIVVWRGNYPLQGVTLTLLDGQNESLIQTSVSTGELPYQEFTFQGVEGVRRIRLSGNSPWMVLSLAEVQAFGYPETQPIF